MVLRFADFGDLVSKLSQLREGDRSVDVILYDAFPEERDLLPRILANGVGSVRKISGFELRRPGDLTGLVTNMEHGDVLFVEDLDRVTAQVQDLIAEIVLSKEIRISIGEGAAAREVKVQLPTIHFVGATTRPKSIVRSLRENVPFHVNCAIPLIETWREMLERERAEKRAAYAKRSLE